MHVRTVAHRDLKLHNLLLERAHVPLGENRLKLIDFGFAARFSPGQRTLKTVCGTDGFAAPEILSSQLYDERCDVFSAGVILHCVLCGKMPHCTAAQVGQGDVRVSGLGSAGG